MIIRKGVHDKPVSSQRLVEYFEKSSHDGKLYVGYPIVSTGEGDIVFDATWISKKYGIVIFDLIESNTFRASNENLDSLYSYMDAHLRTYPELKISRKELGVDIEVIRFAPNSNEKAKSFFINENTAINSIQLDSLINKLEVWENADKYEKVISVIQSLGNLSVKSSRRIINNEKSKGGKIQILEKTIATLDNDQEGAVINYFEGIQRIRGLAGSGKTIVLALKAAYLHAYYPNWKIAVVFNTRALKDQFKYLISKFIAEKKRELPDFANLNIVNAWGRRRDDEFHKGLYYQYCLDHHIEYMNYGEAKSYAINNGYKSSLKAFEAICDKALKETKDKRLPKFDAILVDEAQDLSPSFLKLCYAYLKEPKRLIYAYDEMQKLNEGSSLPNPLKMFGRDGEDTILKKCYRNSRPLLATAHALGFGIYRKPQYGDINLVQFFDEPQLWSDVGYEKLSGEFKADSKVDLYRPEHTSPKYLESHSPIEDLISFKNFKSKESQAEWVANDIERTIKQEELDPSDIIVINPIGLTTKSEVAIVRSILFEKNIKSHIAGDIEADIFFEKESVAFTGINRAKGNEVPMVYVINAQECYSSANLFNQDLIKRRNILFTAITRSKAWVRVLGVGERMERLISEFNQIKMNNFHLKFTYPSDETIKKMNLIHRDLDQKEKDVIRREIDILSEIPKIVSRINLGDAFIEDYPKEIQDILAQLITDNDS